MDTLDDEYVALANEAKDWIEKVTGKEFTEDFIEELSTGVLLCRLMRVLLPGSCKKINKSKMPFSKRENVSNYLRAARKFGVIEFEMFSTEDLCGKNNLKAVIRSLHALGRTAQAKRPDLEHTLGTKVVEKSQTVFSEEQLRLSRIANAKAKNAALVRAEKRMAGDLPSQAALKTMRVVKSAKPKPDQWLLEKDPDGREFYHNPARGFCCWAMPAAVAVVPVDPDWEEYVTPDGKKFAKNSETGEVLWDATAKGAGAGKAEAAASAAAPSSSAVAPPPAPKKKEEKKQAAAAPAPAPAPAPAAAAGGEDDLDPEWEAVPSDEGTYYRHKTTYETTWEKPVKGAAAAGGGELDPEWEEVPSEEGTYYRHKTTFETRWDKPIAGAAAAAATGADVWEARDDGAGNTYYFNTVTGESSWEKPA